MTGCDTCGGDGWDMTNVYDPSLKRFVVARETLCPDCGGEGSQPVPFDMPCDTCDGTGVKS